MPQVTTVQSFPELAAKKMEGHYPTIGRSLINAARAKVPVDTGELRDSIQWGEDNGTLVLGATASYAPDVEFGTSTRRAQPFLRPAMETLRTNPPKLD